MGIRSLGALGVFGASCALAAAATLQGASAGMALAGGDVTYALGSVGTPSSVCTPPSASGVSYQAAAGSPAVAYTPHAAASGTITVAGSGFMQVGCSAQVRIGEALLSPTSVSAGAVTIALSAGNSLPPLASGTVAVVLADPVGGTVASDSSAATLYDLIQTPVAAASESTPPAGSVEHVTGQSFTPFATPADGGLSAASVSGTYSGCPGGSETVTATVVRSGGGTTAYDRALTLPVPADSCSGRLTLTFTAPKCQQPSGGAPACAPCEPARCVSIAVDGGSITMARPAPSGGPSAATGGSSATGQPPGATITSTSNAGSETAGAAAPPSTRAGPQPSPALSPVQPPAATHAPVRDRDGLSLPAFISSLGLRAGGNPLVLWLSAATALLVALGVLVNLDVLGRGVWSFAWRRVHLRRRARNRL